MAIVAKFVVLFMPKILIRLMVNLQDMRVVKIMVHYFFKMEVANILLGVYFRDTKRFSKPKTINMSYYQRLIDR